MARPPAGIPALAVPRLSHYYRVLLEAASTNVISSDEISELTGYSAAQVRRDLACFGQFGTPGKGYPIGILKKELARILGLDRQWNVVLVGAGYLGQALLRYKGFRQQGFQIVACLDNDPAKQRRKIHGVSVYPVEELSKIREDLAVQMAIVTVPAVSAQKTVDLLIRSGICSILNFAPVRPKVPVSVMLHNIDLTIELERLSFQTVRFQKK